MEATHFDRVMLINKPLKWTSFDVVAKLRKKLKIKKIGHAGTLDPLATGLLIICTGKMTKQIDSYQAKEKEYTGSFVIGKSTPSHDAETEVDFVHDITHITAENIRQTSLLFQGHISQTPPMHSAIKIGGKRAYALARKGKDPELKAREVFISLFEITAIELPVIKFRIVCSKGTYIRSIVRDFGDELKVGAYLTELCRTRIGEFFLSNAQNIEDIDAPMSL